MSPTTRKLWDAWNDYMATAPCMRPGCPMCPGYHYANRIDVEVINAMTVELMDAISRDPDAVGAAKEIRKRLLEDP